MPVIQSGDTITVYLKVTDTMTANDWRAWGRSQGKLVKRATTTQEDIPINSNMTATVCEPGDTDVLGILINASGSDYLMHGAVQLKAAEATVKAIGNDTPITPAQAAPGVGIKFNNAHECVVNDKPGGFGQIIGGTLKEPRIAFLSTLYIGKQHHHPTKAIIQAEKERRAELQDRIRTLEKQVDNTTDLEKRIKMREKLVVLEEQIEETEDRLLMLHIA